MPNYRMPDRLREDMCSYGRMLTTRRMNYQLAAFPLTLTHLQRMIMTDEQLDALRKSETAGVRDLPRRDKLPTVVLKEDFDGGPDLVPRSMALMIHVPEPVLVPRNPSTYWGRGDRDRVTLFDRHSTGFFTLRMDLLDDEERDRLGRWVNATIKMQRLKALVDLMVAEAMKEFGTTAHLLACWPLLATFAKDKDWRDRFRNPVRDLSRFGPRVDWYEQHHKTIQVAEIILNGAELMDDYKQDMSKVVATVVTYEGDNS